MSQASLRAGCVAGGLLVCLALPAQAQFYVLSDLGSLIATSYSVPHGLSENADVVGYSYAGLGAHAFIWTAEGGMQDLGTLGGGNSYGKAIGASGAVVGYASAAGAEHAFLWTSAGGLQDLGTLGGANSYAKGVNAQVRVVGQADTASGAVGFVWSLEEGMQDLNGLIPDPGGWTIEAGLGINDQGVIVAMGRNVFGRVHALLLVPVLDE